MVSEKPGYLLLANIFPFEVRGHLLIGKIFEIAHLVMKDVRISWHRYDPRFYPYGFDAKLYAGLTATLYILVALKCFNTWILLMGTPNNMKTHLWTRIALFKLGILLFSIRGAVFRDQRFGVDIAFKIVAALHYVFHYLEIITTFQAIEKLAYEELRDNPQTVFYRRWTWCRLPLKKLNVIVIITMVLLWVLNFTKSLVTGVEEMSRLRGFGDTSAVILGILAVTGICLVGGSLNAVGIILRNVKILLLTYYTMLTFIVLTVKIDVTYGVMITFITNSVNANFMVLVTDVHAACMLRWVTYITLQRTLPIGDANLDQSNFFLSKDNIPKQAAKMLEDMYVQMPWRLAAVSEGDVLGEGHFSKVYKTEVHVLCTGKPEVLAAKEVQGDNLDDEDYASALVSEIKTLQALGRHDNLVEFAGLYNIKPSGGIGILLEYCENGCLLDHLRIMRDEEGFKPDSDVFQKCVQWSNGIAKGMEFLHRRKVVHGDFSTRNILLDRNMVCKISDFGMSFKLYTYQTYKRTEQKPLPFRWMPPEVLVDYKFSLASDIWAYGVTLWEIFSLGEVPWGTCCFDGEFVRNIRIEGERLERPKLCPEHLYANILMKCWELEPHARLDATRIVAELEDCINPKPCSELQLIITTGGLSESEETA